MRSKVYGKMVRKRKEHIKFLQSVGEHSKPDIHRLEQEIKKLYELDYYV